MLSDSQYREKHALSEQLGQLLAQRQLVATTAESCTGGGISTAITDIAGSSSWFDRAFITYSNEAKMQMLGVKEDTLLTTGAVSQDVVEQMVTGAVNNSNANVGISVSGVAGPSGGSKEKPVGTVWIAWQVPNTTVNSQCFLFEGDREQVRHQTIIQSIQKLIELIKQN